jgi:hypothetical protein
MELHLGKKKNKAISKFQAAEIKFLWTVKVCTKLDSIQNFIHTHTQNRIFTWKLKELMITEKQMQRAMTDFQNLLFITKQI